MPTIANCLLMLLIAAPIGQEEEALPRERMEQMLRDNDAAWIVQAFRRHADDVLGFFDEYLEGGLKIIEDGGDSEKAHESFRTALKFARLADEAFKEVIFSEYAASFGSWSPQEQKRFRQGQAEVKAAREAKDDAPAALSHYEKSLALAEPLADWWGVAMAQLGIAKCKMAMSDYEGAKAAAMAAAELSARLQLRPAHVKSRLICGQAHAEQGNAGAGRGHLRIAWESLKNTDDPKLRQEVLDAYCTSLEASGNSQLAADLRAANEVKPKEE